MASLVGSLLFPLKFGNDSSESTPLCASGAERTFNLCNSGRRIICSCMALPQNFRPADEFSATKHNDLSHLENLSMVREHVDDSDGLIECREVYKSFGEKHILKVVNFKDTGDWCQRPVSLADLIFYNDIYCSDKVFCRWIDCGGECCSAVSVNASNAFGGGTGDACTIISVMVVNDGN